uniref:ORFC n=1 Tax=Leptospira interrogans serovar Pomona TaxID=44276 RepID=Q48577_LEPIR|nr:ORFC [Leptospira interrogans serovar Pomona]
MTNEICVYYNKPLYDQKVILRLLEFYKSNYIPFLFSENQRRTQRLRCPNNFPFYYYSF